MADDKNINTIEEDQLATLKQQVNKLRDDKLLGKLALVFLNVSEKYQFEKNQIAPFNTKQLKKLHMITCDRTIQNYILECNDKDISDREIVVYDKLKRFADALKSLPSHILARFELYCGKDIVSAMIMHISKSLPQTPPVGLISQEELSEYDDWFAQ